MKFKMWLENESISKLGIISDVHEDIEHLREAFMLLNKCDSIGCLGDFTGYSVEQSCFLSSRDAHAVVRMLKDKCEFCVVGNHDLYSISKLPKIKTKGKIKQFYDDLSSSLTKKDEKFIRQCPEFMVKKYDNLKILFSHYAFPNLSGRTESNTMTSKDAKQHFAFIQQRGCTLGISGHDHFEGIKVFTENKVREITFNTILKLTSDLTWLHGPSVGRKNETPDTTNGVLILDIDKMEIKAIPLKSTCVD